MAPKAPSEGTKVDLGRNAPVTQENAGIVTSDSLAAESTREGGEFSQNKMRSENESNFTNPMSSSNTNTTTSSSSSNTEGLAQDPTSYSNVAKGNNPSSSAGTAPSYVADQNIRDSSGPHGRNVEEVSSMDNSKYRDGQKLAMEAEPGSINDPSRLAEQQFEQNQNIAGGDTGPRQSELTGETTYDNLGANESV